MHYIISGMERDPGMREDCYSEACLRLLKGIDRWQPDKGPLKSWVSAVTRNAAVSYLKKQQRHLHEDLKDSLPSEAPGPEDLVLKRDEEHRLRMAIAKLHKADQELIYRKYYYLQSTEQIASEFGRSARSIEGRLYRIRKKLGRSIQDIQR